MKEKKPNLYFVAHYRNKKHYDFVKQWIRWKNPIVKRMRWDTMISYLHLKFQNKKYKRNENIAWNYFKLCDWMLVLQTIVGGNFENINFFFSFVDHFIKRRDSESNWTHLWIRMGRINTRKLIFFFVFLIQWNGYVLVSGKILLFRNRKFILPYVELWKHVPYKIEDFSLVLTSIFCDLRN